MRNRRWILVLAAFLFAAIVGGVAYNFGVEQGIAQSGKFVNVPPPMHYGYGWGWGAPFFFRPLFFILFIILMVRLLAGGGGRWHHHARCGYHERRDFEKPDGATPR